MTFLIFRLPRELCRQIVDQLSPLDVVHLSATCKLCRDRLAPKIFKTISFRNTHEIAESALAAATKFGRFTTRLKFTYDARMERTGRAAPPLLTAPVLLPATKKLLEGFALPKLETIRFNFRLPPWVPKTNAKELLDLYDDPEHHVNTVNAEERYEWRALLNETYRAISENNTINEISINPFMPISVSAFYTQSFRKMLSRIERAYLELPRPSEYGGHDEIFALPGYTDFVSHIPKILFCHMNNLCSLHLHAARGLPLGGVLPASMALTLLPDALPALKHLFLANSFVCPALLDFIRAHKDTLRRITLRDCAADFAGDATNPGRPLPTETWAYFFSKVLALQSSMLVEFAVEYKEDILLDLSCEWYGTDADLIEIENVLEMLDKVPHRRMFSYAMLQTDTGRFIIDRQVNKAQAMSGIDSSAFQDLQRFVKGNAARIVRENGESKKV